MHWNGDNDGKWYEGAVGNDDDDDGHADDNDDMAVTNVIDILCLSGECLPASKLDFCKMILCPNIGLTFHYALQHHLS